MNEIIRKSVLKLPKIQLNKNFELSIEGRKSEVTRSKNKVELIISLELNRKLKLLKNIEKLDEIERRRKYIGLMKLNKKTEKEELILEERSEVGTLYRINSYSNGEVKEVRNVKNITTKREFYGTKKILMPLISKEIKTYSER